MKHAAWWIFLPASILAGCASNPVQTMYIMPAPTVPTTAQAAPSAAVLKLRPVRLPDYLDTTDIVTRSGRYNIESSQTGRWGERLSHGITRSLAADLGHSLHVDVVTEGQASRQIEVAISAFDVTTATSVLAASWTETWPGDARPAVTSHGTFSTRVAPPGNDAAVVAAMAASVAKLADGIAAQ